MRNVSHTNCNCLKILAVIAVGLSFFIAGIHAEQANANRPNILFIISDDQSWLHAGAYGDRQVKTPAFDRIAEEGDATPISWLEPDQRYVEKLATPDTSIADLIGDIDPIKAATKKLAFSDEGVIHYGILPRTNRGIFAINELPDLQARIQVGQEIPISKTVSTQVRKPSVSCPAKFSATTCFSMARKGSK